MPKPHKYIQGKQGMSDDEEQWMGDRRQIENKHEIRGTKYEARNPSKDT